MSRALSAGAGAWRALVEGARGEVCLVFGGGAYVTLGSEWLLLSTPGASFGPLSVAVDGLEWLELRPGAPALVESCRLMLGSQVVSLERVRRRGAPAMVVAPDPSVVAAAAAVARTALPDPPAVLAPGLSALATARLDDAVRLLAGRGDGLTPAGDDVLAGYAAARVVLAAPVALVQPAMGRSSPLGLAYLRCAERGELPDAAARLLAAICRGAAAEARAALGPLREWGSSSGTAMAWGIGAAFTTLN